MREISRFANSRAPDPVRIAQNPCKSGIFPFFSVSGTEVAKVFLAACHDGACIEQRKLEHNDMPKYIIERKIPNAGKLSLKELRDVSAKYNRVLRDLGPQIQWVQSYITDDRLYCVYIAPSAELIREHAVRGGFPLDSVREVKTMIDPTVAE
jgi:hypothetical protein